MEEFRNTNDTPQSDVPNPSGGVFGEQSYSEPGNVPVQPVQPVQNQYQNGYAPRQPYTPSPDEQYRNMYSNNQHRNVQNSPESSYAPSGYGAPVQPAPDVIPPVYGDEAGAVEKKSRAWLVVLIICVILLFGGVVLLLAFSHEGEAAQDNAAKPEISSQDSVGNSSDGITVNINVQPKPALDELYQNKETGLLTTAGAAKQALPSIVTLYGYTTTSITVYNEASGVIISDDGYIITNAHAVADINRVKVKLFDDREFEAKVIGIDTRTDLAVIKIDADDLTPAVLGKSADLSQGEQIIAVGNAGGFNDSVTVGYVSYVGREIQSYTGYPIECIQTDAALNFGNSGGALVNLYGQVVGIVTSKYSSTGSENIGFAIEIDFAVPVVEDLISYGYITNRPRIGISYYQISAEYASELGIKPGLLVSAIDESCDIANTELQPDDIIIELEGVQMLTDNDIKNFQNAHKAGDVVTAKVYRKSITGEISEFEITFRLEEDKQAG